MLEHLTVWRHAPITSAVGVLRRDQLIPLSPRAVEIVKRLFQLAGNKELLFAADNKSGVISENTLLYPRGALRDWAQSRRTGLRRTRDAQQPRPSAARS